MGARVIVSDHTGRSHDADREHCFVPEERNPVLKNSTFSILIVWELACPMDWIEWRLSESVGQVVSPLSSVRTERGSFLFLSFLN